MKSSVVARATSPWVYRTVLGVAVVLLGLTTRRRYRGTRKVPAHGGAVIACNHISYADPLVLVDAVRRSGRLPRAMGAAFLFDVPVLGWLLRRMGHIPVRRGTKDAAAALGPAVEALRAGELVVCYPEGGISRTPGQWPMPGRTGAARLALEAGVPVVPVAQWGVQDVLPPTGRRGLWRPLAALLSRRRVQLVVGDPLHLEGSAEVPEDVRAGTVAIMTEIERLLAGLRGDERPSGAGPDDDPGVGSGSVGTVVP